MRTVTDPTVLRSLVARLGALRPDSRRRWGTLSPIEMLCHIGDATGMVLRTRPRSQPAPSRSRPIVKLLALWSSLRWPHGWATNPMHDPKAGGTQPSAFAQDLERAVAGLEGIAAAKPDTLEPVHGFSVRCRSATGNGGRTSTPTITYGSLACDAQSRRKREAAQQGDEADER